MILKDLNKISISELLIFVLLIIILLQRCGGGHVEPVTPKVIRDTVWINHTGTTITKPEVIKTVPYTVTVEHWNKEYLPDTSSMSRLVKQYESIVKELLAKNVSSDTIKIDSIGHVYITDTVSKNMIISRMTHYDLHYPVITNTIIVPEKKKGQMYFGFGVGGHQLDLMDNIKVGLLYKNKQDVMFGPSLFIQQNGTLSYGIEAFWKIKLHK